MNLIKRLSADKFVKKTSLRCVTYLKYSTSFSYYVLPPELPPDTPQDNIIMNPNKEPIFDQINATRAMTGCAKLCIEMDVMQGDLVEKLSHKKISPDDFEAVFHPIEKCLVPLNYAFKILKLLRFTNESALYVSTFERIVRQVETIKNDRWLQNNLCNVALASCDNPNLSLSQRQLAKIYAREAKMNGTLLGKNKADFMEILKALVKTTSIYRNRVIQDQEAFKLQINDSKEVENYPKWLKLLISGKKSGIISGMPWHVSLSPNIYHSYLQYEESSINRWNLWKAFNNRGYRLDRADDSNHNDIKKIREYRGLIAKMLGFESYLHMSLENKVVDDPEKIINLIDVLQVEFHPNAKEAYDSLVSVSGAGQLQGWDIPYYRRVHYDAASRVRGTSLGRFFPFPMVWDNLLSVFSKMFGISFEIVDESVYSALVTKYVVSDSETGETLGSFFFDPYMRPGKLAVNWTESIREGSEVCEVKPLVALIMNIPTQLPKMETLINRKNWNDLVGEFGNVLQQVLSKSNYSELSGQVNLEQDALKIVPLVIQQLVEMPSILKKITHHIDLDRPMQEKEIKQYLSTTHHMGSLDLMHHLYVSAYDLEMCMSDRHWYEVMASLWPQFHPGPLHESDHHPNSMHCIASDRQAGSSYSQLWSQMMACDIVDRFFEAENEHEEKMYSLGKRFRQTFLELGSSCPTAEIFRQFQGRDPSYNALIKYLHKFDFF